MLGASQVSRGIEVLETQTLAVYAVDMNKNEYIGGAWGTLNFDGVQQVVSGGRALFLGLEVGSKHVLELLSGPSGYVFDHWEAKAGDSWVAPVISSSTSTKIDVIIQSGGPNLLIAYFKLAVTPTSITMAAPDRVGAGAPFTVSGVLRRSDTNEGLANQTINLYYDSTLITSVTTGSDGSYSASCTIPTPGKYTLTAEFPGSGTQAAVSLSRRVTVVGIEKAYMSLMWVLAPLAVGATAILAARWKR